MFAVELVAGWVIFLQWFDNLAAEHSVEAKVCVMGDTVAIVSG